MEASSAGLDKGSTFRVELPLGNATERRVARDRSDRTVADLRGIRVVVVDDRPDERELFAEILSRAGATVEVAESAASALTVVERIRPNIIVSDIAMPGEDGYAFVRKLRGHADPAIASTPAVALTAHARAEDRQKAFTAGFQRYIAKPVLPEDLVRTVGGLRAASISSRRSK